MFDADRGRGRALLGAALLLALLRHDMAPSSASAPHSVSPRSHPVREEPVATPPPVAPAPPEDMLWAGCTEVKLSPTGEPRVCTFIDRGTTESVSLRVWLPSRVSEPVVALDGTPIVAIDAARVDDGWSLVVQPGHAGHLTVSGRVGAEQAEQTLLSFAVEFRPRADKELRAELDAAVGKPQAQRALTQRLREQLQGEVSPPQRLLLTRYLQYVTYDLGDEREAVALAMEAASLARAQGEPLTECSSQWAASFMLGERMGEHHAGLEILHRGCDYPALARSLELKGAYYRGLLELNIGRVASARRSIEQSFRIARRLRWRRWEAFASNPLVHTLAAQGRFGWARQILEQARALAASEPSAGLLDRCETEAQYHRKLGDLAHREADLSGGDPSVARPHWLAAQAIYRDRTRCPDHPSVRHKQHGLELDLARAAMEVGELDDAAAMIAAIPPDTIAIHDVRRRLLRAELELRQGHGTAAVRILEDLAADRKRGRLAEAMESEERWRFHVLWARAHQARGDLAAALGALARAQTQLDADGRALGMETDRHAAMRRKSSELLVRLLLEHGQERAALCAARIARARSVVSLAPLDARAHESRQVMERARTELFEGYQWYDPRDIPLDERMALEASQRDLEVSLPAHRGPVECDLLPAPRPGEASLLYVHDGHGFVGFGWGPDGRVVVHPLSSWPEGRSPDSLGDALISPFASILEGATRLRVLAPAAMHDVSFADLPWRGRPLGDVVAVAHAVDLPRVPRLARREQTAALVLADPHKRLMGRYGALERRFDDWGRWLEAHGLSVAFAVPPSTSPGRVTVQQILERTRGVELALFYGFGADELSYYDLLPSRTEQHEPARAGFGVGADVLTRSDVLLEAGQVPRQVILAHCDSASVDAYGVSGATGLAQSYVQAGSEWALGAVGDVAPDSMEVVVDTILESLSHGSSVDDVALALQLAKRRLAARGLPHAEHLRLWVL